MKNELGIEVKCENCIYYFINDLGRVLCDKEFETRCKKENLMLFRPRNAKLEKRIKELQEQQFTKEELQFIKNRLDECIEEWDVPEMVFTAHQILKKIEANDR